MQDHRKRKYYVEVYVKDDQTDALKADILALKAEVQKLQGELASYRMRTVGDITDIRLAIKSLKLLGAPQQRIERLEAFLKRYIDSLPGR